MPALWEHASMAAGRPLPPLACALALCQHAPLHKLYPPARHPVIEACKHHQTAAHSNV
jgi:hypothetical protein